MFFGRSRPRAPRRVLLAHEYGAGRTHVANLLAVARHLRAAGIACLASVEDTRCRREFEPLGIETVQSVIWPGRKRWVRHVERSDANLTDILGNLGYAQADAVAAAIAHYDGLFALFAPDLVLAENAHGALLAARGRLPAVAFGYGQLLPPVVEGDFAPFRATEWPRGWTADEVLGPVNAGLARSGRPPLATIGDLLAAEAVLPFGPEAFDAYAGRYPRRLLPLHVPGFRPGPLAGGEDLFVYLQGFGVRAAAVLGALLTLRRPVRAYLPDLDPADRAHLLAGGVRLEETPVPMQALMARTRSILHHGGNGLTAAALAAGLPQTILSKEYDNRLSGGFVEREGLGQHRWLWDADTAWIVESARAAYDDEALRSRCRERAPDVAAWFGADPSRRVAEEACRLLGVAPPPPDRSPS